MNDLWPNAYLHTLSPFALKLTETFGIRWYGLAYLAGFLLGFAFIQWLGKRGRTPLPPALASDFVFCVALGTVVGGRLGYCLLYSPELFLRFSGAFPFWGVLAINEGGMASHGGFVGVIVACCYFGWRHKVSSWALFDLTTIGGCIGIFFGRIANFINGELFGREAPAAFAGAVKFPQELFLWAYQQPEKLRSLAPVVRELGVSNERWDSLVTMAIEQGGAGHSVNEILRRIIDSVYSGNPLITSLIRPLLTGRYPSQLYEAFLEGLFPLIIVLLVWMKPRKPGVIAALFLVIYPAFRFVGEQFRLPDMQIGFQLWGLTRGQWLSVGMLVVAAVFLLTVIRRTAEPIGGLRKRTHASS